MVSDFQVVFDCADPRGLSAFWSKALGYEEEPPPTGFDSWEAALTAWKIPEEDWNKLAAVVPPGFEPGVGGGPRPRLLFMRVPEGKAVKNRLHLDISAGGTRADPPAERWEKVLAKVSELEGYGAKRIQEFEEYGSRWIVMNDPEGNEFCVH
ncbi:MAG TPA: VOC family protein [Actinocrinis sp.]|jgi:hypothetical protein|uniref:VOC family protein n=1 Tax=Actinocrinis sp. TaxID=1920516 RepID=UPI002DDD0E0D|nr:VOC family protein [Actinocrinis sp.]HEV3171236.1 VOC family protein [Actinocrinis sp.]